jgi:BolA family transcriptional regulator, general stress-responsive regulator
MDSSCRGGRFLLAMIASLHIRAEDAMTHVHAQIVQILQQALQPQHLHVRDDSHRHAGHAEAGSAKETHFFVHIQGSGILNGLSRMEQQRRVYQLLAALMPHPIHALSMQIDA